MTEREEKAVAWLVRASYAAMARLEALDGSQSHCVALLRECLTDLEAITEPVEPQGEMAVQS